MKQSQQPLSYQPHPSKLSVNFMMIDLNGQQHRKAKPDNLFLPIIEWKYDFMDLNHHSTTVLVNGRARKLWKGLDKENMSLAIMDLNILLMMSFSTLEFTTLLKLTIFLYIPLNERNSCRSSFITKYDVRVHINQNF